MEQREQSPAESIMKCQQSKEVQSEKTCLKSLRVQEFAFAATAFPSGNIKRVKSHRDIDIHVLVQPI